MISVVIPFRDERENVERLVEAVHRVLEERELELVCVDDGSVDGTTEILQSIERRFPRVRLVRHERSRGQSAAIVAGVRAAQGEWIVTLDGDGQNDPADIPALFLALEQSSPSPSLVVGWRQRRNDPWLRRVSSRLANAAYQWFLGEDTPDVGCGLKLFRRETFLALPHFDHMHRFLPALVRRDGGTVTSVPVHHRPRLAGRSKYGIRDRLWVGIVDLFGLRWLQSRSLSPPAEKPTPAPGDAENRPSASFTGRRAVVATLLAFLFAAFVIFGRLGSLPLLDPDEGRNAEVAREMHASGRWLVPTYNGLPYLDKPALYFRIVASSMYLFGENELAVRLPSALFAVALLGLVYRFSRRAYGGRTAALAVAAVAAMPLFAALARIVIFDMTLAFFVSAAIFAGYRAEELDGPARRRSYLLGAAAAGLATLTKGPVGFILPTVVLVAFAFAERRHGVLRLILRPWNLAVFFALVIPWFVGVTLASPDFPYYGLVKESFERFTTPAFARTGPFYYYLPVLLGVCFSSSCLFPWAAWLAWKRRSMWSRADRLLIVWVLTVPLFFSLSQSKLPAYVLTAVVALGILVARLFDRAFDNPGGAAALVVRRGAMLLFFTTLLASAWLVMEVSRPGTLSDFVGIRGADYEAARALFPRILPLVLTLAALSLLALWTRRTIVALGAFFCVPLLLLTFSFAGLELYASEGSSRSLAQDLQTIDPGASVAGLECYPPGLAFYLGRELTLFTVDGAETTSNYIPFRLARDDRWPSQVVRVSELDRWIRSRQQPVLLLARGERVLTLERLAKSERGTLRELADGFRVLYLRGPGSS